MIPEGSWNCADADFEALAFRQILHASPVGILIYDPSSDCVMANEAAAFIAGTRVEQLVGQNYRSLESWTRDGLLAAADEALARRVEVARVIETVSTFGRKVFAEFRFSALELCGSTGLLLLVHDLASVRRAESAREVMENRLSQGTRSREAADKEMESFFFAVTHDLRAPLRAIDGFAKLVEEDERDRLSGEGKEMIAAIRDNTTRMTFLIEQLLTFARLNRSDFEMVPVDMEDLVHAVYREVVPETERERIDFAVFPLPEASGDPRLLRQVWTNLIHNAVKFSSKQERAHIAVEGERQGRELVYRIRDDGVGFDMRYYGKLFGVFQRLHPAREFEGAGMGLAIVQRAVVRHGGMAWAAGDVGKGAVFSFMLPAADD